MRSICVFAALTLALVACNKPKDSATTAPSADPAQTAVAPVATTSSDASVVAEGALHLGAPIENSVPRAALSDVAKAPQNFVGKTFVTTGTVTAVCEHMGCWMEIKDDAGEAHIKMAGHKFFVPKNASGRKARVLATLEKNDAAGSCEEGEPGMAAEGAPADSTKHGSTKPKASCRDEAEAQLGRPLAKLSLIAEGVELM